VKESSSPAPPRLVDGVLSGAGLRLLRPVSKSFRRLDDDNDAEDDDRGGFGCDACGTVFKVNPLFPFMLRLLF
jgi:hypothetical protein